MPTPLDVALGQSDRKPYTVTVTYEMTIEVWANNSSEALAQAEKETPTCFMQGDYGPSVERTDFIVARK